MKKNIGQMRFGSILILIFLALSLAAQAQSRNGDTSDFRATWPPEVFPNPTSGAITIDLGDLYEDVNIRLWNNAGEQVHQEYHHSARKIAIFISSKPGDYVLEINTAIAKTVRLRITRE
jgi:hypothetical protein